MDIKILKDIDGLITYLGSISRTKEVKNWKFVDGNPIQDIKTSKVIENIYDIIEESHEVTNYSFKELGLVVGFKIPTEFKDVSNNVGTLSPNSFANNILVAYENGLLDKRIIKIFGKQKHNLLYDDLFNKNVIQKSKIIKNNYVDFPLAVYGSKNTLYYRVSLSDALRLKKENLPSNFVTLFKEEMSPKNRFRI